MSSTPRFQLLVKAGQDGRCYGDCPFSHRAYMFARLRVPSSDLEITPVNTVDKPESFLKLSPEGKVPVLVDRAEDKVIADSGDITKYIESLYPSTGKVLDDTGAAEASSGLFSKFVQYIKNKDEAQEEGVKKALIEELEKLDSYLKGRAGQGKFLLCDDLTEVDCQVLPKLRHVQVSGGHYKKFKIPEEFTALNAYIKWAESSEVYQDTCPNNSEIVWGWSKFFT